MVRVFATQFKLDPSKTLENFQDVIRNWIINSRHNPFDSRLRSLKDISIGDYEIQYGKYFDKNRVDIVGIKYTHPGEKNKDTWSTEVVGKQYVYKGAKSFDCSVVTNFNSFNPKRTKDMRAKSPIIVRKLINEIGGDFDGQYLTIDDKPKMISDGERKIYINFVSEILNCKTKNRLPIIYISRDDKNQTIIKDDHSQISQKFLAKKMAGLAHVLIEPDRKFSYGLREKCHDDNAFGGAIGIYWGLGTRRTLFLPDYYTESDGSVDVERLFGAIEQEVIDTMKVQRLPLSLTWDGIRGLNSRARTEELKLQYMLARKRAREAATEVEEVKSTISDADHTLDSLMKAYEEEYEARLKEKETKIRELEQSLINVTEELSKCTHPDDSPQKDFGFYELPFQVYEGEFGHFVSELFKKTGMQIDRRTRLYEFLNQFVTVNEGKIKKNRDKILQEIKPLLNGELNSNKIKKLSQLGINVDKRSKHYEFSIKEFPERKTMFPATPSDHRGGKNNWADMKKKLF